MNVLLHVGSGLKLPGRKGGHTVITIAVAFRKTAASYSKGTILRGAPSLMRFLDSPVDRTPHTDKAEHMMYISLADKTCIMMKERLF